MRSAERLLVCLVLLVAFALPARAQEQRLPLSEVLKVGRDAPDLLRQVDVELRRNDLKPGDVACLAARLGDQWKLLSGGQAAPYQCQFGDRTLRIEADRTYFDNRGKRLGRPGEAGDETLFDRAKSFREVNLRWIWVPEYPR